jgi:hypothetical protein
MVEEFENEHRSAGCCAARAFIYATCDAGPPSYHICPLTFWLAIVDRPLYNLTRPFEYLKNMVDHGRFVDRFKIDDSPEAIHCNAWGFNEIGDGFTVYPGMSHIDPQFSRHEPDYTYVFSQTVIVGDGDQKL